MYTYNMKNINLGDKVKDSVTGFIGIAIGQTKWITGCDRIIVQPQGVNKEGKTFDTQSFDIDSLVVVTAKKVKEGDHTRGGPISSNYHQSSSSKN